MNRVTERNSLFVGVSKDVYICSLLIPYLWEPRILGSWLRNKIMRSSI